MGNKTGKKANAALETMSRYMLDNLPRAEAELLYLRRYVEIVTHDGLTFRAINASAGVNGVVSFYGCLWPANDRPSPEDWGTWVIVPALEGRPCVVATADLEAIIESGVARHIQVHPVATANLKTRSNASHPGELGM